MATLYPCAPSPAFADRHCFGFNSATVHAEKSLKQRLLFIDAFNNRPGDSFWSLQRIVKQSTAPVLHRARRNKRDDREPLRRRLRTLPGSSGVTPQRGIRTFR